MASLLFTIGGSLVNALAFSGTNFVFSTLTNHGEEERKRRELALKRLQSARDEWNKDRIKRLDFINKRLRKKMKQGHTSTILMRKCLNIVENLQKKLSLYRLSPSFQIFAIHQRIKKMENYYLLQWVQALQHIPYTSTFNK